MRRQTNGEKKGKKQEERGDTHKRRSDGTARPVNPTAVLTVKKGGGGQREAREALRGNSGDTEKTANTHTSPADAQSSARALRKLVSRKWKTKNSQGKFAKRAGRRGGERGGGGEGGRKETGGERTGWGTGKGKGEDGQRQLESVSARVPSCERRKLVVDFCLSLPMTASVCITVASANGLRGVVCVCVIVCVCVDP